MKIYIRVFCNSNLQLSRMNFRSHQSLLQMANTCNCRFYFTILLGKQSTSARIKCSLHRFLPLCSSVRARRNSGNYRLSNLSSWSMTTHSLIKTGFRDNQSFNENSKKYCRVIGLKQLQNRFGTLSVVISNSIHLKDSMNPKLTYNFAKYSIRSNSTSRQSCTKCLRWGCVSTYVSCWVSLYVPKTLKSQQS